MNIFGIGPLEIVLVLVLALIIFGPKDLQKTGQTLGRTLNRIIHSDTWKMFKKTSAEMNNLPRRLMKEAALDDVTDTIKGDMAGASAELGKVVSDMNTPPSILSSTPPVAAREPDTQNPEEQAGVRDHA